MNAVKVHAILLVVALLVALQTWTRDEGSGTEAEVAATVWEGDADAITSVRYDNPTRMLRLNRRRDDPSGDPFLWGVTLTNQTLGDTTGTRRRDEFPVGEEGQTLLEYLAALPALRELDPLDDEAMTEYELAEPARTLSVTFGDDTRTLALGGTVYGAAHRYALDPATGRSYVISYDVLRLLEGGQGLLQSTELHRYDPADVAGVSVRTPTAQRRMMREGEGPGATWTSADAPGEADQTFANFMERVEQVQVFGYAADLDPDTLAFVMRFDYTGSRERPLGFLEMFQGPPDEQGNVDFFVRTEATRILARAYRSGAARVTQDLADVF